MATISLTTAISITFLAHCKRLRSHGQSVPKTISRKKPQSGKNWFKLAKKKIHKICFNHSENSSKIPFVLV